MKEHSAHSGSLLGAAAADCETAIRNISVDPRDIPSAAIARIAAMTFPTDAKEREAAAIVRSWLPKIAESLASFDVPGLRRVTADMEERCKRLAVLPPSKNFNDHLRECIGMLRDASWSTEEAEALRFIWRHSEAISGITPSAVTLGTRRVTRAQAREELADRGWSRNYLQQLENREKQRNEVDAENIERAKRGHPPIHFTGAGA